MPSVLPSVSPQPAGAVVCGGWHLPYFTSHPPPCTGLLLSFWDFSAPLLAPGREQAMLASGLGGSWCEVLFGVLCMLIFCLKRSIKKIQRENWQKPLFLPQGTPYIKLSLLEWLSSFSLASVACVFQSQQVPDPSDLQLKYCCVWRSVRMR